MYAGQLYMLLQVKCSFFVNNAACCCSSASTHAAGERRLSLLMVLSKVVNGVCSLVVL